jgi:hypothetical protein
VSPTIDNSWDFGTFQGIIRYRAVQSSHKPRRANIETREISQGVNAVAYAAAIPTTLKQQIRTKADAWE